MKSIKKLFLCSVIFILTTVSVVGEVTSYDLTNEIRYPLEKITSQLNEINSQLIYYRLKYDNSKVVSIVSKDPVEFAKKLEEYITSKNKTIFEIWHNFNEEKQEYVAIIYYNITK